MRYANSEIRNSLHTLAANGKCKDLRVFLNRDSVNILEVDQCKRTVLHYAAEYANPKEATEMVDSILSHPDAKELTQTEFGQVVGANLSFINYQDAYGNTALHLAAMERNAQIVSTMIDKGADLTIRNINGETPIQLIFKNVPSVMKHRFDHAVTCKKGQKADEVLMYKLDFGEIILHPKGSNRFAPETSSLFHILEADARMRKIILEHPLVQIFMRKKWQKIRLLIWLSILYHALWLALYSLYIYNLYVQVCPYRHGIVCHQTFPGNVSILPTITCKLDNYQYTMFLTVALLFISITVICKEFFELWKHKFRYFTEWEKLFQWSIVGTTVVGFFPFGDALADYSSESLSQGFCIKSELYETAALGILVAWAVMLRQIAKIPTLGAYIEIFLEVMKGFVLFVATFFSLFIGFALALRILMPVNDNYDNFFWGVTRLLVMMAGDPSMDELFDGNENPKLLPHTVKFVYLIFVIFVIVILFNLLIAMTVSDTQKLQQNAETRRLSNQLRKIHLMETFIFSSIFQYCCIPWVKRFMVVPTPTNSKSYMVEVPQSEIPSHLQSLLKLIVVQYDITKNYEETELQTPVTPLEQVFDSSSKMGRRGNNDLNHDLKSFITEMFQQYEMRRHDEMKSILRQLQHNTDNTIK